jgi:hypothetical protein
LANSFQRYMSGQFAGRHAPTHPPDTAPKNPIQLAATGQVHFVETGLTCASGGHVGPIE